MARYIGANCRLCRRENQKLYLKGERCFSEKCALSKRPTAPGQHGARKSKMSNYGVQLREKQKVKRYYGILEGQFREIYEKATKLQGIAGENLLKLLELRFDNVVYRMGFANSRKEARQLVVHGHFTVNGKNADIPSMTLKVGDVVNVKERSNSSTKFKELVEKAIATPKWIEADANKLEGKIVASPAREDVDLPIEEHLIIELYSR